MALRYIFYVTLLALVSCSKNKTQVISKTSQDPSILEIDAGSLYSFGTKNAKSTTSHLFTIYNKSANAIEKLSAAGLEGAFSFTGGSYPGSEGTCGNTLLAEESCTIQLTFHPPSVAFYSGELVIQYSYLDKVQTKHLSLKGYGSLLSDITTQGGDSYDFGDTIEGKTKDITIVLKNTGYQRATELAINLEGPFMFKEGQYPGQGGSCGNSLDITKDCRIVVTFNPQRTGVYSSALKIHFYNSTEKDYRILRLKGVGIKATKLKPAMQLDAKTMRFNVVSAKTYFSYPK